jgi:predicted ester cyclase
MASTSVRSTAEQAARENFRVIEDYDLEAVTANVTAGFRNERSTDEPLAARSPGPEGMRATVEWLNRAFTGIRFDIHDVVEQDGLVAVRVTMNVTQHGPFVVHDATDASVTDVFPSRGRSAAVDQTHWFRVVDGRVAVHDAVRDDLGMARQLGWVPPSPPYLLRMALARRTERRCR